MTRTDAEKFKAIDEYVVAHARVFATPSPGVSPETVKREFDAARDRLVALSDADRAAASPYVGSGSVWMYQDDVNHWKPAPRAAEVASDEKFQKARTHLQLTACSFAPTPKDEARALALENAAYALASAREKAMSPKTLERRGFAAEGLPCRHDLFFRGRLVAGTTMDALVSLMEAAVEPASAQWAIAVLKAASEFSDALEGKR